MNRRKFFAFLPIAPAALMIEGARASSSEGPWDGQPTLSLSGQKKPEPFEHKNQIVLGHGIADPNKRVDMAVGRDGNLWLRSKDQEWKRIVTE